MCTNTKAMPTVKFSLASEFLAELVMDKDKIHRQIVRVTQVYRPDRVTPVISHLVIVATARIEDYILQMESYVGQVWGQNGQHSNPVTQETQHRAQELISALTKELQDLGVEIRCGMWEAEQ